MPSLIAVPIMVADADSALADANLARDHGADLVELRLDEFFDGDNAPEVLDLVEHTPLPCIATCRPTWEGGQYAGDEDARINLFERLIAGESPPRHIDIELAAFDRTPNLASRLGDALAAPGDRAPSLIVSIHDFDARPPDLTRRLLKARELKIARVIKVAHRARSLRDNLEMFDLLATRDRPMIALAMGEFGLISRVLAPKFGGYLTFASLRESSTTAPGQPTVRELFDLYRFNSITPETSLYGVVGWPVAHSLSPHVHNAAFEHAGLDAVYLPLPIAAGGNAQDSFTSLKATLLELLGTPSLHLRGLSVTLPHKEGLVALAREQDWRMDSCAARVASANTLTVRPDAVTVTNTDAPAAIACLQDAAIDPAGSRIAVLGAGGVGRALAIALADAGAKVFLANRTAERAQAVADHAARLDPPPTGSIEPMTITDVPTDAHAYINATPLGMPSGKNPEDSPLADRFIQRLHPGTVLFDTVYRKGPTPMLKAAHDAGLRAITGLDMFIRQAAAQLEGWTQRPAPTGLIEQLARARLED